MGKKSPVGQDSLNLLSADVGLHVDLARVIEENSLGEDIGFSLIERAEAEDRNRVADRVGKEGDEDDTDDDGEESLKLLIVSK